ncbi:MAG: SpoIIIAH-like family protein [Oscillospiraceae bacterium]|nr:SpoIIIAH-like family protein [Oscillospiraceae bacterium]
MNKTKKYITIAAVLLCVCAAVYLNWSYNNEKLGGTELSDAELANVQSETEAESGMTQEVSDYFAQARLTRQQSRDEALDLLKAAAASESASQETIDGVMNAISAMANYSMQETQIENLLLAKNFAECVAFISADGVTLAVPAPAEGLAAEDVAKITDAIVAETDFAATQIRIIEVKNSSDTGGAADTTNMAADDSAGVAEETVDAEQDGISTDTGEMLE